MRVLSKICLLSISSLALAENSLGSATEGDHLVPVQKQNYRFRTILADKLATTPFDCGRVTIRPSFEGESSISIYCGTERRERRHCYLTYIIADDNLYQRTDGGSRPESARKVTTHRINVELPVRTAEALKEVWFQILKKTRSIDLPRQGLVRVPVDATAMEFSLPQSGASPLLGEVDPFAPALGKKVKELIILSQTLIRYSKAGPAAHSEIAARIDRQANGLLQDLKRDH